MWSRAPWEVTYRLPKNGFHAGLTGLYTSFNRDLQPQTTQIYRRWQPAGRRFWNAAVDYGYLTGRFAFNGETATDTHGQVATIHVASLQLNSSWQLMALQRYYPYQFVALMGESFSEGGSVNNESGVYLGAQWQPLQGLKVLAYADAGLLCLAQIPDLLPRMPCHLGRWNARRPLSCWCATG